MSRGCRTTVVRVETVVMVSLAAAFALLLVYAAAKFILLTLADLARVFV